MTSDPYPTDANGGAAPPPRRRRLRLVAVALGLAVLGGLGGYVYHAVTRPGGDIAQEVPLIRADDRPIKKRPDEPGGMAIPNQDKLVYEMLSDSESESKVEVLLPRPEEPLPAPVAAEPEPAPPEPTVEAAAEPQPAPPEPTVEAAAEPQPAPPEPAAEPEPLAPPSEPKPAPESATVAAVPPAPATQAPKSAGKGFMVQFGAFRDPTAADAALRRIFDANTDLLGDLTSKVERADLGADKGVFWRLRSGPLADGAAAKTLCDRLNARKLECFVIRP